MLRIEKNDEIEQLRQMAIHFKADFIEDLSSARLDFDNENGRGYISTYEVFPGLVAKLYNVELQKEIRFEKKELGKSPTYFIYCVKGHYFHKFSEEDDYSKIFSNQNVILSGNESQHHNIILPAGIKLKISILFLNTEKFPSKKNNKIRRIENSLKELSEILQLSLKSRYFGNINTSTAQFSKVLIENRRVDTIGKLITEGAILNTLASQLLDLEEINKPTTLKHLSQKELKRIIDLSDYINKNISTKIKVKDLADESGLYPRKLQQGFQYLYGETIANFIHRLRLEKAKHLLQSTNLNISEISYHIGISSRSYFSKSFQEYYGMSPTDFQNLLESKDLIFELSYKSKASTDLSNKDVQDIINTSLKNNSKQNITGALVLHSGIFFQIIEGKKEVILDLYDKILKDKRHSQVKLIWSGMKPKRTFDEWSLAFLTDKDKEIFSDYESNITFIGLNSLLQGSNDYEIFSDILWRRVLNILKEKMKNEKDQKAIS